MLNYIKIGDLVKMINGYSVPGIVIGIGDDWDGILVLWSDDVYTYEESNKLEIVSESR